MKFDKFVRIGPIDRRRWQKIWAGRVDNDRAAPTRRGFYAMPHAFQDRSLLGCIHLTQPELFPRLKEKDCFSMNDEENEAYNKELDAYERAGKDAMRRNRKVFKLAPDELIWTHLDVPRGELMARSGSWRLCTVSAFGRALTKEYARETAHGKWSKRHMCKDWLEVFVSPRWLIPRV